MAKMLLDDDAEPFGRRVRRADLRDVMRAARHLSAHRMAMAANQLTPGIHWNRCRKAHIARSLLAGDARLHPMFSVDRLVYVFESFPNSKGELALTERSREAGEEEFAKAYTKLEQLLIHHRRWQKRCGARKNHKLERDINSTRERVEQLSNALNVLAEEKNAATTKE